MYKKESSIISRKEGMICHSSVLVQLEEPCLEMHSFKNTSIAKKFELNENTKIHFRDGQ